MSKETTIDAPGRKGTGGSPEAGSGPESGSAAPGTAGVRVTEELGVPLSLVQAVEEVDLLLAFTAQKGLDIDKDTFAAVARAKEQMRRSGEEALDPTTEAEFWKAYQDIANKIKPATVVSIKAGSDRFGAQVLTLRGRRRLSTSRLAARRYQRISIAALIALLALQLYTGMGSTILNDFRAMQQRKLDVIQMSTELEDSKKRLVEDLTALLRSASGAKGQDDAVAKSPRSGQADASAMELAGETEQGLRDEIKKRLLEDIRKIASEQVDAQQELTFLRTDLDAKQALLEVWPHWPFGESPMPAKDASSEPQSNTRNTTPESEDEQAPPDGEGLKDGKAEVGTGAGGPGANGDLFGASENEASRESQERAAPNESTTSSTITGPGDGADWGDDLRKDHNQHVVLLGLITLKALNVYILPLFYGLLGACAYVLRRLSTEIREYVYSPESDIRLKLRLYLGALSGFAVAWFLNESTAPGVADSIAPLALAFVAGYSVEVVFAAMDNLVSAFSRQSDQSSRGP